MGATVVMACRSPEKSEIARKQIINDTKCPESKVIFIKLDLCGFDSVKKFVREFENKVGTVHVLINNAGVMMNDRNLTQDGFELVFTSNHLSHFLLTNLLLPYLKKTNGRIINVASSLHKGAKSFNFDDVMSEHNYSLFGTYSQSKLANVMFTIELQKRLDKEKSKVTCNSIHPGCVQTEVTRHMSLLMRLGDAMAYPIMILLRKTPLQGAYSSIYAAISKDLEGKGGLYLFHCKNIPVSKAALDDDANLKLWDLSAKLTGVKNK